ncbi:MAG: hypothetical protein VYA21_06985, partial [Verrucomicrobiota bacterium]|nr:hypothetical protein [Verrucomicrobiota bacterium]
NISRPWKKNYIWGWLQGLSELPISSLDRLILGAMSLELLGVFAFIKQINSLFGMLNTYYANKLFSHLRTHGSSHLTPRAWPDQKALAIAAIIGGLTLSILYSYRLSTLNEVFIPHTEIITIFVLWSCITVSFYHVHIGTNLNGLTKEAFFIHILANSGYFAIVLLATFTERPLAYAVTALIAQQLLIILMKQRVLYLWYRKAN